MGLLNDDKPKNTRAIRVRKLKSKLAKLEKAAKLKAEEDKLKKKLASLR